MQTARIAAWQILLAVGAFVLVARAVGRMDGIGRLLLGAPPLSGAWGVALSARVVWPVVIGALVVAVAPVATGRLRWWMLLVSAWLTSAVFTTALAAVDGREAVSHPLATGFEYRAVLGEIEDRSVAAFVQDFVDRLPGYPTHVRGHPVATPLVFWVQERLGFEGAEWSAALVIIVGTSVVVSAATVVRLLCGESVARRAVPFLAITPSLVWVGTSADAFIAGTVAAAVAFVAVSVHRADAWSPVAAIGSGALGALALHLSYGSVVMLLPMVFVVAATRRWSSLVLAAIGAAAVTVAFVAAGFWWFDGLEATRAEYVKGAGGFRPFWYFATMGNPAALLLALGPAVVVALVRLRDRRLWWVVGGALVGVVLADVSGMSKGEVERIWLPFVPFLTVAAAGLSGRSIRWWLAAQAAAAILLQIGLDSPW
ncbi:MAG: hypothetical protein OSA99_03415 [Acidimicrobiales bacterium]|nr:hypothetical protein [Acidimicrobiales bacterium]